MAKVKVEKEVNTAEQNSHLSEIQKIRKMDDNSIQKEILDAKRDLFNLRFQAALGKLTETSKINKTKKHIARLKTVETERSIAKELGGSNGKK